MINYMKKIYKKLLAFIFILIITACTNISRQFPTIPPLSDIIYCPHTDGLFVPKEWWIKKVRYKEMEKKFKDDISWQRLKPLLLKGDEIWYYKNPREYWEQFKGQEGYAIIRTIDGEREAVGCFFTFIN